MRTLLFSSVVAVLLTTATVTAQKVSSFPMEGNRKCAGLMFWGGVSSPGHFFIQYGQPSWKKKWQKFAATDRKATVRLGKDAWTTLDSNLPLNINGTIIPAGYHYLGLRKQGKGKWGLAILDPKRAHKKKMTPLETRYLKPRFVAPLVVKSNASKMPRLLISVQPKGGMKAHLDIRWGNYQLSAPVEVLKSMPKANDKVGRTDTKVSAPVKKMVVEKAAAKKPATKKS